MPDIVKVDYKQTGESKSTNQYGMREMQEKAYESRDAKYLLLKAPPASGKSRALMFLALDKLNNQGLPTRTWVLEGVSRDWKIDITLQTSEGEMKKLK